MSETKNPTDGCAAADFNVLRKRPPKTNDIATIVEIYKNPPVFELECVNDKGETEWIESFSQDEIEMELIGRSPNKSRVIPATIGYRVL